MKSRTRYLPPHDAFESFAERLHFLICYDRTTQEKLGNKVGVTQGTVSDWEVGKYAPKGKHLVRLADAFGVDPRWFLPVVTREEAPDDDQD